MINEQYMKERYDPKTIGARIKEEREKRGLSLDELGRRVNVSRQTLSKWEQGKESSEPSINDYLRLCNEFGCDLEYLLCENECMTKDLQGVCDYTGLTESAVERLHFYTGPGFQHIAEMLSSLITDEYFIDRDIKEISSTVHVLADNVSYLKHIEKLSPSYDERDEIELYKAGAFGKCQLAFMGFVERYARFQGLEDKKT